MHITGEEAAAINIAIGALLALGSTTLAQRHAHQNEKLTQCREAYAALILATDHLENAWMAPKTLGYEFSAKKRSQVTGEAVRAIQRGYVTVRLVGSKEAKKLAGDVMSAAWDVYFCLYEGGPKQRKEIDDIFDSFVRASASFNKLAEQEADGRFQQASGVTVLARHRLSTAFRTRGRIISKAKS